MKSIRKSAKGFTFVELIVVMAIIAVLTATLVMAVGAFLRDKKYDDANAKAESIYRALQIKLNQYDAEGHKTIASDGSEVEGIGGVPRKLDIDIYVGNSDDIAKSETNIGICKKVYGSGGGEITNLDPSVYDARDGVVDFDMHDAINTIYTKRNNANVTWNPSWMAKIDMETYTVKYVLYTEDSVELQNYFFDRCGADDKGYYVDIDTQQSSIERARLNHNVVGCYPIETFYN